MTNFAIIRKAEIAFWDRAIPLMSESPRVRYWLREIVPMLQDPTRARWIVPPLLFASGLGLFTGFLVVMAGTILR